MRSLFFLVLIAGTAMAEAPPTGWVHIVSRNSGKCLDMTGGPAATNPGVSAQQWTCVGTGQTNQIFQFVPVLGGYEIQVVNSGLAIGPLHGATASGTAIEQFPYNSSNEYQTWIVKPGSISGYFTLRPESDSNACLDVSGISTSNGAQVWEWSCWGGANEDWKFVPLTIAASPTVASVSPNTGLLEGGTEVTIKGTNFATDAMVSFGGRAAANVFVASSTEISAVIPEGSAGPVTVTVTNPGQAGVKLTSGFTYAASAAVVPTISSVQANWATPQSAQTTVTLPFTSAQRAGDLNVVVVGWNDSTAKVKTVTDSTGNTYTLAVGPTVQAGTASQSIYYAKNIKAAAAKANSVKVTFSASARSADIRVLEYSGIDQSNPVDVTAAGSGNSATSSSGSATTKIGTDLIFGANLVQTVTSGPGSGFTERLVTSPDGDIAEDRVAITTGSYSASAQLGSSGPWIMQMVAFRPSSGTVSPPPVSPPPVSPPPQTAHSVALSWKASTSSNVTSYRLYRSTGTGTSYSQLAAGIVKLTYTDSNVTSGATYKYVVTAVDSNGNESSYSNAATATIPSS